MGDVDYRPDRRGIGELAVSPEVHGLVDLVAYESIPFARAISPDAPPYGEGYVTRFVVDGNHTERIARSKRAVAYLVNESDYAVQVELGALGDVSRADTGHHVLSRTLDHIENG